MPTHFKTVKGAQRKIGLIKTIENCFGEKTKREKTNEKIQNTSLSPPTADKCGQNKQGVNKVWRKCGSLQKCYLN